MSRLALQAAEVLHGRAAAADGRPVALSWPVAVGCLLAGGGVYGLIMGCYGGVGGGRMWQPLFAAAKVPFLLLVTFGVSLPSFFVLNTLAGLRSDFQAVLRAVAASQATLTLVLVSLAPYTAFWYCSTTGYQGAILFNAVMFGVASLAAHARLRGYYRPLIRRNPRHRAMLWVWLLTYAFVGIQMGWVLRPFIGSPDAPVRFFRQGAWGNAYVVLWDLIVSLSGW